MDIILTPDQQQTANQNFATAVTRDTPPPVTPNAAPFPRPEGFPKPEGFPRLEYSDALLRHEYSDAPYKHAVKR